MDNSKLLFSSNWDIDQLTTTEPIISSVNTGVTSIYTFAGDIPVFEIMIGYGGKWYQPGMNGILTAPNISCIAYISGNAIYVNVNKQCSIRLYVWSDKVIY